MVAAILTVLHAFVAYETITSYPADGTKENMRQIVSGFVDGWKSPWETTKCYEMATVLGRSVADLMHDT
jgi:hypothetical protein